MSSKFDFGRQTWVQKDSKFGTISRFGPFLAEQVRSSGFLEGFKRVRISFLVDEPGFE